MHPLGATLPILMDKEKSKKRKREGLGGRRVVGCREREREDTGHTVCRFSVQLHSLRISRLARHRSTCRSRIYQSEFGFLVEEPVKLVDRYATPTSTESYTYRGNPQFRDRYDVFVT
ncbi:hypothetical protein M0802_002276 [Mischocyttarus mexicanus]|nr:hypothetical protein M0802_002276 [Mischocyttarus mexicanus]